MSTSFIHLHCHTHFSLLDGVVKPSDLLTTCQSLNMSSVAITDNGTMFGAIDFYLKAREKAIKPILGCELILTDTITEKTRSFDRLILLAKSYEGYQSLINIVSTANIHGFYYTPRIDLAHLKNASTDIIAISHGYQGPIAERLKRNNTDDAVTMANQLKSIFQDNFYLGLQRMGEPQEGMLIEDIVSLSESLSIPLVATNDVYYLTSKDAHLRDILTCIKTNQRLEENTRLSLRSREMYFKTPDEMTALFNDIPSAIENTHVIADQIDIKIETEQVTLPHFACPDNLSSADYLEQLVWRGIKQKYPNADQSITDRVNFEMDIIKKMDYPIYFLIIYDFLNYCIEQDIPVGPGRGSAAGSIVAYALNITLIDPIKYHLLFERFLNPERVSMPDIDIDFCINRRGEVIDYIVKKYGSDRVSQIATFGTMAARGVIRDVGRALNVPLSDVDRIAKLIPAHPGQSISIPEALETVPELKELYDDNNEFKTLIDTATKLEGAPRHTSTHAAGVVISRDPLPTVVPLMQTDGQVTTQYPMGDLEKIGLLKMDILGLRNLTVIRETQRQIQIIHGKSLDLEQIPIDDQATFDLLCQGHTTGVFQLESRGMRQLIKDLKPTVFEDIIALLALYRPGPLGSGMVSDFISNKSGETTVKYDFPELEPILRDTYGLILYQEQVMQIASTIGGFTLGQADMLRRAMGKKKKDVMDAMSEKFLEGAKTQGFDVTKADKVFQLCYKFAEYGFNKSHSAAYALISYQTAYLKANYPIIYMTALLSSVQGSTDKTAIYIAECRRMGISVHPPNINASYVHHSIHENTIQFGFGAIKNVGESAIECIVNEREKNGAFSHMIDLLMRVDLKHANKRVIESLIKSGACDDWDDRGSLLATYENTLEQAQIRVKEQQNGQAALFGETVMFTPQSSAKTTEYQSLDFFGKLKLEKEVLGLYISGHPLDKLTEVIEKMDVSIHTLSNDHTNQTVTVIGLLSNCRQIVSKTNRRLGIGTLEDQHGSIDVVLFETPTFDSLIQQFNDETIIRATGKVRTNNDERSIQLTNIIELDPLSLSKKVHIDLASIHTTPTMLATLKTTLANHKGDIPTYFHYNSSTILAGQSFWTTGTPDCLNTIEEIVGKSHIWIM